MGEGRFFGGALEEEDFGDGLGRGGGGRGGGRGEDCGAYAEAVSVEDFLGGRGRRW